MGKGRQEMFRKNGLINWKKKEMKRAKCLRETDFVNDAASRDFEAKRQAEQRSEGERKKGYKETVEHRHVLIKVKNEKFTSKG